MELGGIAVGRCGRGEARRRCMGLEVKRRIDAEAGVGSRRRGYALLGGLRCVLCMFRRRSGIRHRALARRIGGRLGGVYDVQVQQCMRLQEMRALLDCVCIQLIQLEEATREWRLTVQLPVGIYFTRYSQSGGAVHSGKKQDPPKSVMKSCQCASLPPKASYNGSKASFGRSPSGTVGSTLSRKKRLVSSLA